MPTLPRAARRPAWTHPNRPERIRGHKLQRLRKALFDRNPLCVQCLADGRISMATVRDHIRPLAQGGTDTENNTQALCAPCNQAKAIKESVQGRR